MGGGELSKQTSGAGSTEGEPYLVRSSRGATSSGIDSSPSGTVRRPSHVHFVVLSSRD